MIKKQTNSYLVISLGIVVIATLMPGNGKIAGNYFDKVVHFCIFFLLSVSISNRFSQTKQFVDAVLAAVILGLLTEFAQQYIPGRNMDIYDAMADTLGVVAGYFTYKNYSRRIDSLMEKKRV